MFERFRPQARQAVVMAQEEARALRHHYLGTEHILLGLLHGSGSGARALGRLGVDLEGVRSDVVRLIGRGDPTADEDAEALRSLGIDMEEVRRRVEAAFGPGALDERPARRRRPWRRRGTRCEPLVSGHIPFTARAKKALELSLREATRLGHGSIDTGHLVLGLVREGEGVAAQILAARGATPEQVRALVVEEMEAEGGQPGRSA